MPRAASPTTDFMQSFFMLLSSDWFYLQTCSFPSRRPSRIASARHAGFANPLPRHIADRLDFEPAVHRGAPGLDARPRGQVFAAREIRPVDPIELLGVALIAQPHDDFQQAIHVRAGRL